MQAELENQIRQTGDDHPEKRNEPDLNHAVYTPESLRDKYQFMIELGHGTQARVFLAKRLSDNAKVTIKQLNIGSVKTWKEYDLFHRESEVLRTLDMSGVARFYESIECLKDDPPCSYIVQEYVEGVNIAKMLSDGHRFKVTDVYDIIIQMLRILINLQFHEPPVIHRDIKPSNIMISPDGHGGYKVTLIDFGAVANPQVQTGGSTVAGTFGYMPPEQLMGNPVPASDIYALGAVAVQLLSGKSPAGLPVKDFRLIFEPELEHLPPAVVSTLRRMLEPKVEERACDVPKLIQTFESFKKENYQVLLSKTSKSRDLNRDLGKVRFLGDYGNMDIWQSLSDITPRSDVPYFLFNSKNDQEDEEQTAKADDSSIIEKLFVLIIVLAPIFIYIPYQYLVTYFHPAFNGVSVVLMFVYMVVCLICHWHLLSTHGYVRFFDMYQGNAASAGIQITLRGFIGFVLGVIISGAVFEYLYMPIVNHLFPTPFETYIFYFVYAVIFVIYFCFLFIGHLYFDDGSYKVDFHEKKSFRDTVGAVKLYKNGRKTIATITNIAYCPINKEDVEVLKNGMKCKAAPCFKIQYRFNPPDDAQEEDLIHTCYIHHEPEGHLSIGDPIPILYSIEDNYFSQVVNSMPFPYPISEWLTYDNDMMAKSEVTLRFLDNPELSELKDFDYLKYIIQIGDSNSFDDAVLMYNTATISYYIMYAKMNILNNDQLIGKQMWFMHSLCMMIKKRADDRDIVDLCTNFIISYFGMHRNSYAIYGILFSRDNDVVPKEAWQVLMDAIDSWDRDSELWLNMMNFKQFGNKHDLFELFRDADHWNYRLKPNLSFELVSRIIQSGKLFELIHLVFDDSSILNEKVSKLVVYDYYRAACIYLKTCLSEKYVSVSDMALIMRHMKFVCDKDAWYRRDEKLWYRSGDDKYFDRYNLITEKEAWNEFRNMYDQLCMMANVDDRIVLEQWMEDYKI